MCSQDICLYYVMNKPLFMSRAIFKPDVPIHLTLSWDKTEGIGLFTINLPCSGKKYYRMHDIIHVVLHCVYNVTLNKLYKDKTEAPTVHL